MNIMIITVLIGAMLTGVGLAAAISSNRDAARHKIERNKTNC